MSRTISALADPGDRRTQILRIAARLFAERGFEQSTVRRIGEEASILSGSIYYHFETKEEMLHDIVGPAAKAVARQAAHIAGAKDDPEVRIVALVLLSFEQLFSDADAFAILYNERHFLRHAAGFEYVTAAKGAMYQAWQTIMAAGIKAGRFNSALDVFLTITTIIRMLNTGADWYLHGAEHGESVAAPTTQHLVAFSLDFILHAIRAPAFAEEAVPLAAAGSLVQAAIACR